jgi:iron complex outermembrane recepter protein
VRAALSADLTANLTADVSAFWQRERFDAYQTLLPPGLVVPNAPPTLFGSLAMLGLVQGRDFTINPFETASNYNPASYRQTLLSVAKLKWAVTNDINVTSLTGYVDHKFKSGLDGDGTSYDYAYIPASGPNARRQPSQSVSEELNISGTIPRRGSWLVGAYYFHENVHFTLPVFIDSQKSPLLAPGLLINGGFTQVTESSAIFADATVPITDHLRVFAGARVSREKLSGQSLVDWDNPSGIFRPNVVPLLPKLFGIPARNPTAISCPATLFQTANTQPGFPYRPEFAQQHTPFTPRLGAQYDVTGTIMVYAQYSKGFKDGGHSTSTCDNNFQPETLTSYEAGIKAQFFDRRLTFDASVFHYDHHNMQIFKFNLSGGSTVQNADAKIDGLDIAAEALLGKHFRADVAATLLDDRFTRFCSSDPSWAGVAGPCPNGIGTGQDLRGRALPNVSDYTVNPGLEAFFPLGLGPFQQLTLRGEGRLVGPTHLDAYGNRPEMRRPAYAMLNATATLATAGGFQIRAFGRNLTDKAVISHIIWTGTLNGQYLPPRTFGIELTEHFQ